MLALRKKVAGPGFDADVTALKLRGEAIGKVLRHQHAFDATLAQDGRDNVGEARVFDARRSEPVLMAAEGEDAAMRGMSVGAVNFEIAPSKPSPASTLTASRSSASGRSADTASCRRRARTETMYVGER